MVKIESRLVAWKGARKVVVREHVLEDTINKIGTGLPQSPRVPIGVHRVARIGFLPRLRSRSVSVSHGGDSKANNY